MHLYIPAYTYVDEIFKFKMLYLLPSSCFVVTVLLIICLQQLCAPVDSISIERSRYRDINIEINSKISSDECQRILIYLEQTLSSASEVLFNSLDGRASFGTFNIFLPETWADNCIPAADQRLKPTTITTSIVYDSDITIDKTHHIYGDNIWTQQYGSCGTPGLQIYIPYKALNTIPAKDFIRNWAKYRYGIFDEIGYKNDPIFMSCYFQNSSQHITSCSNEPIINENSICASLNTTAFKDDSYTYSFQKPPHSSLMFAPHLESVTRFCDKTNHNRYAPTKHNLLCGRKPTVDVILEHNDFLISEKLTKIDVMSNSKPIFQYRRKYLTRYVVIIDDTPDILVRDSWSFLRSAIRKWVVYDLQPNTEVGIVLTSAGGHLSKRFLEITTLTNSTNRDLIASFVPYGPSDTHQHVSCLHCAIEQSHNMLEQRRSIHTNAAAHVIIIIAPGMESHQVMQLHNIDEHLVTINYPNIRRGGYPLDTIINKATCEGTAYSVFESKFNSEHSYLQTYFELSTILTQIGRKYYEGSAKHQQPIEIHRHQIQDDETSNALPRHIYRGNFYMDAANLGQPAGFYLYTYATESPLIHTISLTSPMGQTFDTRSDQRMSVRQLSLSVTLNETGRWSYEIERFHGNPQPHIVQVLATPSGPSINIDAWSKRYGRGADTVIILYCKLELDGTYPVMDADVRVSISKRTEQNNCIIGGEQKCYEEYQLYDAGTGSPDIMRGDGIYTRVFRGVDTPAAYIFEIRARSKHRLTYTAATEDNKFDEIPPHGTCCGSEMSTVQRQEHEKNIAAKEKESRRYTKLTIPFERYAVPITYYIDSSEFETLKTNNLSLNFNEGTPTTRDGGCFIYGCITDLHLKHLTDGKLLLYWTSPDLGVGQEVARYELKYGFHVHEMIDFYESASVLWNHDTPTPQTAIGDQPPTQQQFIIDPTLEPTLLNQTVYFGLRAFTTLTKSAKPGPVSNIVGTFVDIPRNLAETTTLTSVVEENNPNSSHGDTMHKAQNNNETRGDSNDDTWKAVKSSRSGGMVGLLLPLLVALTCFIVAAVVLYVLCSCKRRRSRSKNTKSSTTTANISIPLATGADLQTSTNDCTSSNSYLKHINYDEDNTTDTPDHHTVGIPIYQQSSDNDVIGYKKRLSTSYSASMLQQNFSELHDYAIDDRTHQQQNAGNKRFFSGLSIISMQADTLRRNQQQPLKSAANFDNWSHSMLLMRDNSQQHSPFIETIINQVSHGHHYAPYAADEQSLLQDTPPVVPPLPSTPLPEFYNDNRDMPTHTTTVRNDGNGNFFNSIESSNKRQRNVTMV